MRCDDSDEEENGEEQEELPAPVTQNEARLAMETVRRYIQSNCDDPIVFYAATTSSTMLSPRSRLRGCDGRR